MCLYITNNVYINGDIYNLESLFNNNKNKIIKINDIIIYLKNINSKFNTYNHNNYFIIYNNKLIENTVQFKYVSRDVSRDNTPVNISIFNKQKGGSLIDAFMSIVQIGSVFLKLGDFISWLLKFAAWFIKFVLWFLTDLLNPVNFFNDLYNSAMLIVISVCRLPFDLIMTFFKVVLNSVGGFFQGFWGWDISSLSKADKNSPYFQSYNRQKGQKSYITNTNTVPFSIILGTLLCPPMGVFMDLGTSGWLNIVVCALLTLLFYLPGLCYALLLIYA